MTNNFDDFRNVTISDAIRIGKTIDFLLEAIGEGLFISKQYDEWDNCSFVNVNLNTLRKHNFVKVNHTTERKIFTVKDRWDTTVVDMTIEQYNNLPDFFKDQVTIETRKTNHYEININRCCDFMLIYRHLINAFGSNFTI